MTTGWRRPSARFAAKPPPRARRSPSGRGERGAAACGHLSALPSYRKAATVLWYAAMPSEVATLPAIEAALAEGKRVAVPWCDGDDLALWRLESIAELEPGAWGIPEPVAGRRRDPERQVAAAEIELAVVPGLAFDRSGRRLGRGKGYYDRLLARSPPSGPDSASTPRCSPKCRPVPATR